MATNGFDKNKNRAVTAGRKGGLRNAVSSELREARALTAKAFEETASRYMASDIEALKGFMADPKTPIMDLIVIKLLIKSLETSDENKFDFLLNRTIGRVADKLNIKSENLNLNVHAHIIQKLSENDPE